MSSVQTLNGTTPAGTAGPTEGNAFGLQGAVTGAPLTAAQLNDNWQDLQEYPRLGMLSGVVSGGIVTTSGLNVTIPSGTIWYARQAWKVTTNVIIGLTASATTYLWGCSDGVIRPTATSTPPAGFDSTSACILCVGIAGSSTITLVSGAQQSARSIDGRVVTDGPLILDYGNGFVDASAAIAFKVPGVTSDPSVPGSGVYLWYRTDTNVLRASVSGSVTTIGSTGSLGPVSIVAGASQTINWPGGVNVAVLLTANCTLTFTAPPAGSTLNMTLTQDGTGSRLVTWPSSVKWGGSAPTLSTAPGAKNAIQLYYDGTDYIPMASGGLLAGVALAAV